MNALRSLFCILLVTFLATGCTASKNHGTISRSDDVKNTFEADTVVPDHTYYYTGSEAQPTAIIGISNKYTLQSKKNFWTKVDISPERLHSWNLMFRNDITVRTPYRGAYILGPGGEQIGIWYSRHIYTSIKFVDANTVVIVAPGP